jgi:hypothetical protein
MGEAEITLFQSPWGSAAEKQIRLCDSRERERDGDACSFLMGVTCVSVYSVYLSVRRRKVGVYWIGQGREEMYGISYPPKKQRLLL